MQTDPQAERCGVIVSDIGNRQSLPTLFRDAVEWLDHPTVWVISLSHVPPTISISSWAVFACHAQDFDISPCHSGSLPCSSSLPDIKHECKFDSWGANWQEIPVSDFVSYAIARVCSKLSFLRSLKDQILLAIPPAANRILRYTGNTSQCHHPCESCLEVQYEWVQLLLTNKSWDLVSLFVHCACTVFN